MLKLAISHAAYKVLADLQAKQYKQVGGAIFRLLKEGHPHDSKALRGARYDERRVDCGEYRIVYAIHDDIVEILVIGKHNDDEVYRAWLRTT